MNEAVDIPAGVASSSEESVRLAARALAHDLNNLIGAVLGHASYLRMIVDPGSEADQTAAVIESAAERARHLAAQLQQLGAGSKPPAAFAPVDLHAVAREVAATLGIHQLGAAVFSLKLTAPRATVHGDAHQLNQLLMNLAVNACEAMSGTGGEIAIETAAAGERVLLEVRDNGPGIPAEHRTRVFEPSYTTKPSGGGLGLAIARSIARNHGASIEVDANQPRGTVFRLQFPPVSH
jgi:signal transduction histidine kinase